MNTAITEIRDEHSKKMAQQNAQKYCSKIATMMIAPIPLVQVRRTVKQLQHIHITRHTVDLHMRRATERIIQRQIRSSRMRLTGKLIINTIEIFAENTKQTTERL